MQDGILAYVFSALLLQSLTTSVLTWFWWYNRSTPGLSKLIAGCVSGFIGLALAFESLSNPDKTVLVIEYGFLIASHLVTWLGIASFWQRQTRNLTLFAVVMAVAVYMFEALFIVNGGDVIGRVAIASAYYALSSIGILIILLQAKAINREIYHTALNQSQVGTGIIAIIFMFHACFNAYQFITWEGAGLLAVFGMRAPLLPLEVSLSEALVFTPLLVLGIVIMVTERLQTELRIEQMLDPITKGLNKRAFIAVSKAILARARRNADAVTLIMVDVTNFNYLRKQTGRQATDILVAQLGTCIFKGRRAQDIFCRFSDDEFMLLLPGTPEEGAQQVMERVQESFVARCNENGDLPKPEASIAASTARGDDLEIDGMIETVGQMSKSRLEHLDA